MAKLYLKFEQAVLKEYALSQGVVTIGRLPDNLVQIDNPAVSGHHARIFWETDHYVIEDNNSTNGTYLNNRRISRQALKENDEILIGKHTVLFKDAWHEDAPAAGDAPGVAIPSRMDATMMLDTRKAKEMLAQAAAASAAGGAAVAVPSRERVGNLTVLQGKTDQSQYMLTGKLTMIGKSDMATIKLKRWFAPKAAAVINRRDHKYFIAAAERHIRVRINEAEISGQHELNDGDIIEVARIKMSFSFTE